MQKTLIVFDSVYFQYSKCHSHDPKSSKPSYVSFMWGVSPNGKFQETKRVKHNFAKLRQYSLLSFKLLT